MCFRDIQTSPWAKVVGDMKTCVTAVQYVQSVIAKSGDFIPVRSVMSNSKQILFLRVFAAILTFAILAPADPTFGMWHCY